MTREEKQTELKKIMNIVSATLDYLLTHYIGSIIYDDFDPSREYYEQQKLQATKYFKQRRFERLEQQLIRLTEILKHRVDLKYQSYIKEITDYNLDLFETERQSIKNVLANGKIVTDEESRDVIQMIRVLQVSPDETMDVESLSSLLDDFYKSKLGTNFQTNRKENSEIVKTEEKDGIRIETIRIMHGPKPVHFNEREVIAPDGKRKLMITEWSDGKHPSTNITILFNEASGPIYAIQEIYPDLNVFWKNNNTIIIETKKNHIRGLQHRKVQSFDDIIFIEYIEK